jgi:hypothetical protein
LTLRHGAPATQSRLGRELKPVKLLLNLTIGLVADLPTAAKIGNRVSRAGHHLSM